MATVTVNGVRLAYEQAGAGAPMVLVHGSWTDRRGWDGLVPLLAERYRVIAYDRRGHSDSERPPAPAGVADHAADLAALVEGLDLAPAHLVTSSFGGEVGLRVALERPGLVASLALHEPPLYSLLADSPQGMTLLSDLRARIDPILALLERGEHEAAARQFVDTIAMGPGVWEALPEATRQSFLRNAATWLGDMGDPSQGTVDTRALAETPVPVLLTEGRHSSPEAPLIMRRLAELLPHARRHTFPEAGHIPHRTHPDDLAQVVEQFLDEVAAQAPAASDTPG